MRATRRLAGPVTWTFAAATVASLWLLVPSANAAVPNPWPSLGVPCATRGFTGTAYDGGINCRFARVQNYPRRFVVWIPPRAKRRIERGRRVGVVFMLHGTGGTGERALKTSGWREKARREGFVAVFPTGLVYLETDTQPPSHRTKWNSFDLIEEIDISDKPPGFTGDLPAHDVKFFRRILGDLNRRLRISRRRVYLSGFSDGGQMCGRVGVEMSNVFAAVGCNAGSLDSVRPTTAGHPNISMLLALGSQDSMVLAEIQRTDPTVTEIPLDPQELNQIPLLTTIIRNSVASIGLADRPFHAVQRPTFTELRWRNALAGNTDRNSFHFLVLAGVGHEYPTRSNNPNGVVMANRLWRFFEARPRR